MQETGEIIGYDVDQDGSWIQVAFPGRNLMDLIAGKHARSCTVWIPDGRGITPEQRKKAYATIADIADYTGELPEVAKEWLKYLHIARTGNRYFSLSDCTRDEAREFISTLMDLALEWGIPLGAPGVDRAEDIERYLWSCLKNRRCAAGRERSTMWTPLVWAGTGTGWMIAGCGKSVCAGSITRRPIRSGSRHLWINTMYTEFSMRRGGSEEMLTFDTMDGGLLAAQFKRALQEIGRNIMDPNTDP